MVVAGWPWGLDTLQLNFKPANRQKWRLTLPEGVITPAGSPREHESPTPRCSGHHRWVKVVALKNEV